jgi:phosphoenolpyruvate-protein phosphotransferase (PTS system enzyme I)
MKTLKGITAAPGMVRGTSCLYSEKVDENIPHYVIDAQRVPDEIERLNEAYKSAALSMRDMLKVSEKMFGKIGDEIFRAHNMILEDRTLRGQAEKLVKDKLINAEHAVSDAFDGYIDQLRDKQSHFAEITHDMIDVKNRIISSFSGSSGKFECPIGDRQAVIVVAERLTPSMIMSIPREHVLAFVTEEGGFTTHATILARNYGVPVIFGIDIKNNIDCGSSLIVDGPGGRVIIDPDRDTDARYKEKIDILLKRKEVCLTKIGEPAITQKGERISLKANISSPGEVELLKDVNYDGIGLLRSEFILGNRNAPPSEEEWLKVYRHILEEADGKSVVIRLLDIGGDKMPGYITLPEQENPDLGIRGARAMELFRDIYLTQIRAILRASLHGEARMLYPMVSDRKDIESYREVVASAIDQLRAEKLPHRGDIKEGIMIETPSAAIMAGSLLEEVDFANIGSNDLIQYTLAASRGNQLIEKRYHIMHPSLVRLMEMVAAEGRRLGKEICLCGEIAAFEEYYPLLLEIGLRSFSAASARVEDLKCHLMHTVRSGRGMVERFYQTKNKEEIDSLFGVNP